MTSHTITGTYPAGYNVTAATLFNQGTISGPLPSNGVGLYSANSADIINSGTIAPGSLHPAVSLHAGGTLTNQSGGTIGGAFGVSISGGAATLVNAGGITAAATNGVGVYLAATSVNAITNAASGSIAGAVGIDLLAGGTLTNAGTITGSGGTAVAFGGTGSNLLVLDPGAVFAGAVVGSASASNELELASTSGVGTVNGFGVSFSNFATVSVDAGASWVLDAASTIAPADTLLIDGTLTNDGTISGLVTLNTHAMLSNASVGTIGSEIDGVGRGAALVNAGTIAAGVSLAAGGSVTNAASASISGSPMGVITGYFNRGRTANTTGTVVNDGSILGVGGPVGAGVLMFEGGSIANGASASIAGDSYGVDLEFGGSVTNAASGVITGGVDGMFMSRAAGTVVNDGSIAGTGNNGRSLDFYSGGGSVANGTSGSITGYQGIRFLNGAGTVFNDGSIAATGTSSAGIDLEAGGTVTNAALASVAGGKYGVELRLGGTLTNAGTIVGNSGTAVTFGNTGRGLLVLDPGYGFSGIVLGSASAHDTLELASAASAGVLTGLGTEFVHFPSIVVDAGATWAIGGTVTTGQTVHFAGASDLLTLSDPGSVSGTIDGFNDGNTIALAGIADVTSTTIDTHNLLTVTRSVGAPLTLQLDPSQDLSAEIFHYAVVGSATDITMTTRTAHWVAGSGNFNTAADWSPQGIPGATDGAVIDAAGTYTVTASSSQTVDELTVAANAKLVVSAGTFTVSNGSGGGGLAGSIIVHAGAVLALARSVLNSGTISGAGQLGAGLLNLSNAGTVNANASVGLTIDLGGQAAQNLAGGLIEATAAGGLTIASGAISNEGAMLAAKGSTLTFQSGVVNPNNAGGVLNGGTWEADGNGSVLAVTGGVVTTDAATIILSGAGSAFRAGDGSIFTNLEASLTTIAPIGTLELLAGRSFAATNGISDLGMVQLAGGTLTAPSLAVGANGRVSGFGTIADPLYALSGAGTLEANGGTLAIAGGTISNAGTMLAANGSTLTFQPGVVNTNNTGGVLTGGTWEASGSGSTLSVTGGAVTQDKATIILSGAGSLFRAGDGTAFTSLQASLGSVAPIGTLELLAGRPFAATPGIADMGMIQLGGGTLTLPRLALASIGHVSGFGEIADTRYALTNGGTIEANGGTLAIATAIDPTSTGVFQLDAASLLEIAADQGANDKMNFLGAGSELIIDAAQKFGLNVGTTAYTGPLVQNFGTGDAILLKNVAPAGLTPVYDTATGIVQLGNGSTNAASLMFDKATLGTGSFHLTDDGGGHALLTHS